VTRKRETKRWPVQDAKARFSEFLDASLTRGPQIVTRRGEEMAVLVRVDHWRQLEEATRPRLKDLLLAAGPRAEVTVTLPDGQSLWGQAFALSLPAND
jgi:prevent-host-death family protein